MLCIFSHLGGSLADALSEERKKNKCLSEAELTDILIQIAQGLKYIHSQNLVHLDIKLGKCINLG